jgi:uncharacterized Zn-finger protein
MILYLNRSYKVKLTTYELMFSSFTFEAQQDDGKAFACSRCTRRFKRAEHLQRHTRTRQLHLIYGE